MFIKVRVLIYFKHFLIYISIQNHSNESLFWHFQVHMESHAVLLTINLWPSSLFHWPCQKKKSQYGSCEFDFIWDLLRTIVWEPASQKPLKIFSKEAVGEVNEYIILIKGEYMHSSRHLGRKSRGADIINDCSAFLKIRARNWVHTIFFFKKYLTFCRSALLVFPRAQNASFLISALNFFQEVLKASNCRGQWLHPCRAGR